MPEPERSWSHSELKILMSKAGRGQFRSGEVLFRQGDPGECVYLIRRGLVEIFPDAFGTRRRLSLRGRGEVIGEMAVLDDLGRSATAVARTDMQVLTLDRQSFEDLLDREPALVRRLTQQLSKRLRELQTTLVGELDKKDKGWREAGLRSIGPYKLLEELGQGGMGIIYRAVHQRSGQECAVKVIPTPSEDQRTRFSRECEMMARLVHPHIARIESGGLEGHFGYLAMELLQGESLENRLTRGPLLERELQKWFVPALEGLGHAHNVGVIHRDIKPGNLFLTLDNIVKVLDFGIARRIHGPELTVAGRFFGTPHYLAPERIGGQSKCQERQSDQYSMGVTMYYALTGRPPFDFEDVADILAAHLHRVPVAPGRLASVGQGVEAVILRLLEKDPLRRYPSMQAAADALRAALAGGGDANSRSQTIDFGARQTPRV